MPSYLQRPANDIAVEKEQRTESLLLSGGGQIALHDQVTQESSHILAVELCRMAEATEPHEALGPGCALMRVGSNSFRWALKQAKQAPARTLIYPPTGFPAST
jgi:hypothetical protein